MTVDLTLTLDRTEDIGLLSTTLKQRASQLRAQADVLDGYAQAIDHRGLQVVLEDARGPQIAAEPAPAVTMSQPEPEPQVQPAPKLAGGDEHVTPLDVARRLQASGLLSDEEADELLDEHTPGVTQTPVTLPPVAVPPAALPADAPTAADTDDDDSLGHHELV